MTRLDKLLIAVLFVCAFMLTGAAMAQDGAHEHPALYKANAEQDAAIQSAADAVAVEAAINEAQEAAIAALTARVEALEAQGPTDPTEPPVEPPVGPPAPVWIFDANGSRIAESLSIEVDAPFNICLKGGDVSGPVDFTWDGGNKRESQAAYCAGGGNEGPDGEFPFAGGQVTIDTGNLAPFTIDVKVNGATAPPEPPDPGAPTVGDIGGAQVGPWMPPAYNTEGYYANYFHNGDLDWSGGGMTAGQLLAAGHISPVTGMPVSSPNNSTLTSKVYFTCSGQAKDTCAEWDGDWIVDAPCTGDVYIGLVYTPAGSWNREGHCRLRLTRDYAAGSRHHAVQIFNANNGTIGPLVICRVEDEQRCAEGKILSSRAVAAFRRYDIIRSMDIMVSNKNLPRSIDEMATEQAAFWASQGYEELSCRMSDTGEHIWPERFRQPFTGAPISVPFKIAVEADNIAWYHAPLTFGAPISIFDALPEDLTQFTYTPEGKPERCSAGLANSAWVGAFKAAAAANGLAAVASPEWDRYGDAWVAELIDSGYPEDRPVVISGLNEVWNNSGHFYASTRYAVGIGEAFRDHWGWTTGRHDRIGYGVLMARLKLAIDGALARAGRDQRVVYILEGQAADSSTTYWALTAAKQYLETEAGQSWAAHRDDFMWSVASYWSGRWTDFAPAEDWPKMIADDPQGTMTAYADFVLQDQTHPFVLSWVIRQINEHMDVARKFGVRFIGAYEGGPHLIRAAYIDKDWYRAFLWGPEGARVNAAVQQALLDAFPGMTISNYALGGPAGTQPWFEGELGCDNPYCQSWDPYLKEAVQ